MQNVWSFFKKVGTCPYAENEKDGGGDGHYWNTVAHIKMKMDGVPPHVFANTPESFKKAVIEDLRAKRRYLDDFSHDVVQEILGQKY